MRENNIIIGPFDLLDILECTVHKRVNEHATVKFSGHITPEHEDEYVEMNLKELWAGVTVLEESGERKTLFKGAVQSLEIETENGVKTLRGELVSGSYLMDTMEHTRTFQDAGMLYREVQKFYLDAYPDSSLIMTAGQGAAIGGNKWLLQYQETDWEFSRRLASHFNSPLIPETTECLPRLWFGMRQGNAFHGFDLHLGQPVLVYLSFIFNSR